MTGTSAYPRHSLRQLLAGCGWLTAARMSVGGLGLLQTILLARLLGIERVGQWFLIVAFVQSAMQVIDSRIWETIIRFTPEWLARGRVRRATALLQWAYLAETVTGAAACLLCLATASWASRVFVHDPETVVPLMLAAFWCLIHIPHEATIAQLRLARWFRTLAGMELLGAACQLSAVIVVGLTGPTLERLAIGWLLAETIREAALWQAGIAARRELGLPLAARPSRRLLAGVIRRTVTFTGLSSMTATVRLITSQLDTLLVGAFAGPAGAAVYRLALRLVGVADTIIGPLHETIFPEMSRLVAAGRKEELAGLLRTFTRHTVTVVLGWCFAVTLLAPWLVPLLFGADFAAAVLLLQIAIWRLIWVPWLWFRSLLLVLNRLRLAAYFVLANSFGFLGLLVGLTTAFGVTGAAVATLLRSVAWVIVTQVVIRRAICPPTLTQPSRIVSDSLVPTASVVERPNV